MKRWKRFAGIFLGAVLVFLLAACNGDASWKNSGTRAFLTGCGLSADHASLLAEVEVGGETTWISYVAEGTKECMVFYQDAGETPVQVICNYNGVYYAGFYGENPDEPVSWEIATRIEREAFDSGRTVLRLPADTDQFENYQSQTMKDGTRQEIAVRNNAQVVYLLDEAGTLTGLRAQYASEMYTVKVLRLRAPSDDDFPKPVIKKEN